jgi:hypothetical protein
MPTKTINTAAGTTNLKQGGGMLRNVTGVSAGTSYTFQIKDGPDSAGNTQVLLGAAAIPVVANQQWVDPQQPMSFRDGLQVVTTGTPGEFFIQYD